MTDISNDSTLTIGIGTQLTIGSGGFLAINSGSTVINNDTLLIDGGDLK